MEHPSDTAGGAHPRVASLGLRPIHLQPLPYNSQKILPKLGGGGPWASRWDSHQTPSAQQSQARNGNRISFNFGNTRPQWAGLNEKRHSAFARRKFCSTLQVRVPRKRGLGKGNYEHKVLIGAVPSDPLGTFPSLGKHLAPQGETL